jgi:hypothetical protein
MSSMYFDLLVGINKVKRAETTLMGHPAGDLSGLDTSELVEFAWALSTILVAAQQGFRLAPEVLALAESLAHSRSNTFRQGGRSIRVSAARPADRCIQS